MSHGVARLRQLMRLLMLPALMSLPHPASATDACSGRYLNPIVIENCGSDPVSWSWNGAWKADRANLTYDTQVLAGYVSRPSVNAGETIHFYVRAPAEFSINFYRL